MKKIHFFSLTERLPQLQPQKKDHLFQDDPKNDLVCFVIYFNPHETFVKSTQVNISREN